MSLLYSKYFTTHTDTENDRVLRQKETFEAYKAYCKRSRVSEKNMIKSQKDFNIAVSTVSKAVGNLIIEKKSGLYIKDFGYFFVFRSMGHTYSRTSKSRKHFYMRRGGMRARIIFIANKTDMHLPYWTFENRFVRQIQEAVTKKAEDGFPYTGLPYTVKETLARKVDTVYKRFPKTLFKKRHE